MVELRESVKEVIQTVINMYDPTKVVVYTNYISFFTEHLDAIKKDLAEVFSYIE